MMAFIFPGDTFGGHENMSLKMIETLQKQKIDIHCYISHRNKRLIEKLKEIEATVHLTYFCNSKFDLVLGFFNPWILANLYHLRFVKGRHRHLVLVNGNAVANHGTTLAVAFYSWLCGIRSSMYIPMVHTASELGLNIIKTKFYDLSIKRSFKLISDVWTIDNEWGGRVLNVAPGAKIYIIKNFVNPICKREEFYLKPREKIELCFVGRVEKHQKGLDYLVKILARIEISGEILVHIVGDGPDLDWLKNETLRGNFSSKLNFKFHGWIPDPLQIISKCDALIMPSRLEGIPLVAIEALMVGTPVFAFSIPGIRELVDNKFLARPFLIDDFSEKLNTFLLNPMTVRGENCNLNDLIDPNRFEHELSCAINCTFISASNPAC